MDKEKPEFPWVLHSIHTKAINQRIFEHELGKDEEQQLNITKFSDTPVNVNMLAVFDGVVRNQDRTNYELIFSDGYGAGAFTFPNPKLILPYRFVADNAEQRRQVTSIRRPLLTDKFVESITSQTVIENDYKEMISLELLWISLAESFRPYEATFTGTEETFARESEYPDIVALKEFLSHFYEPFMDSALPDRFRDGIAYMHGTSPESICGKYNIPRPIF